MRRGIPASAAAVLAVGAVAAILVAVALGAASFADPEGDNNAAPDITSVTVSESPEAVLTITVGVANHQSLPTNSWLNVWFDLDNNPSTGAEGDEALVRYLDDGGFQFYRWSGSELVRRQTVGMTATFTAGTFTLTLPKAALDGVTSFGSLVVGSRGQDDGDGGELVASDLAPNRGRARYVTPGPLSVADVAGDEDAAPDIARVDVSDTKSGTISFAVATPSHASISGDTWIELDVDIDRRRGTGDGGSEAIVFYERGQVSAARWSAKQDDFVRVRSSGVQVRSSEGLTTFLVPRRFLDDVASFDFYFVSGDWDPDAEEDDAIDLAPDGDAWWKYSLVNTAPLRLIADDPRGIPAKPVSGRPFTVAVPVRRSDTARGITSGSVACDLTVAGTRVRTTGRVTAGTARCSVSVPAGASGATLRGTMLVRSIGKSVKAGFAFRVR